MLVPRFPCTFKTTTPHTCEGEKKKSFICDAQKQERKKKNWVSARRAEGFCDFFSRSYFCSFFLLFWSAPFPLIPGGPVHVCDGGGPRSGEQGRERCPTEGGEGVRSEDKERAVGEKKKSAICARPPSPGPVWCTRPPSSPPPQGSRHPSPVECGVTQERQSWGSQADSLLTPSSWPRSPCSGGREERPRPLQPWT